MLKNLPKSRLKCIPITQSEYFLRSFPLCIWFELNKFPLEVKIKFWWWTGAYSELTDRYKHLVSNDFNIRSWSGWLFLWLSMSNRFLAKENNTLLENEAHWVKMNATTFGCRLVTLSEKLYWINPIDATILLKLVKTIKMETRLSLVNFPYVNQRNGSQIIVKHDALLRVALGAGD